MFWRESIRSTKKRRNMSIRCREANMVDSRACIPGMVEVTRAVITTDITTTIITDTTQGQEVGLADLIVIVIR
jgi:hypothetical protein